MRQYYYTNKLLFILAIYNLWMIFTSVWPAWFLIALIRATQGDTLPNWINFLSITVQGCFILGISSWAFFKRLSWVTIPYIIYLNYHMPVIIQVAIQNRDDLITGKFITEGNFLGSVINLGMMIDDYSYILLWLLTLITIIVMLIETNYRDLCSRWRKLLTG